MGKSTAKIRGALGEWGAEVGCKKGCENPWTLAASDDSDGVAGTSIKGAEVGLVRIQSMSFSKGRRKDVTGVDWIGEGMLSTRRTAVQDLDTDLGQVAGITGFCHCSVPGGVWH